MTESERIVRIMQMEQYFDVLLQTDPRDIPENPELEEILSLLTDYCESGRWLADYEADERGELPKNLKRGVLSQDGLYNLLHHIDLQIKRRNTMINLGRFLCRTVTLTLFGKHMNKHRLIKLCRTAEDILHIFYIMPVNGAKIGNTILFKKHIRCNH